MRGMRTSSPLKGPVKIVQKHKTLQNIKEGKNTNQKTKEKKILTKYFNSNAD
jgi:hypothetical protein